MAETVIEYGSKRSYLSKRRSSARRSNSFRRDVMDAINDNVEANPLHRFSSWSGDINKIKDNDTVASSVASSVTSFSSLPDIKDGRKGSKQNAQWGTKRNSRIKLMDRGQLLVATDRESSRLLGQGL
mmetsp:Transcript_26702/g.64968  ORF Transcript_26702/g.64968 Transcript_26702/m.64968 type:complete len:127 (-) Transcript_26702:81-461(-)